MVVYDLGDWQQTSNLDIFLFQIIMFLNCIVIYDSKIDM
jgi:hypothetical protein